MEKVDARKMSPESQEQLRKQVIRLSQQGRSNKAITEITGIHRNTVRTYLQAYKSSGIAGLQSKKRGFDKGEYRTLSPDQEAELQRIITEKTPEQLKMKFALWTRQAVREQIQKLYGIAMPIRTVGEYLKRWGFTPQKPLKRSYEQRPAEVTKWLKEEYPSIQKRAKQEKAEIHWGDETGVRSDSQYGRGYAPKGKTPVLRVSAKRTSVNMISAITNQGKVRFMVYQESLTAKVFITFLKQLMKNTSRKIFLIVDNLRVHHALVVKEWLKENTERIELFYLPAYSPELNPDEYLNCDLKAAVHSMSPARDSDGLKKRVRSHMKKIQKLPDRVVKYCQHPMIAYAA